MFLLRLRRDRPTLKIADFQDMGSHTKRSRRRACSPAANAGIFARGEIPVFRPRRVLLELLRRAEIYQKLATDLEIR